MIKKVIEKLGTITIGIIIVLICGLVITICLFKYPTYGHSDMGQFGDLYGGVLGTIVSALTLCYLIYTYEEMKKQNKLIINQNEHNSFIMLLHNYHEIINDLDTIDAENPQKTLTGREAIRYILETNRDEIENLNHIVESAVIILNFPENSDYNNEELNKKRKTNQDHFKATLSTYEKKAILRIRDKENYTGKDIDKAFDNFINKLNLSK
jgi:uncharacterized membrane protein